MTFARGFPAVALIAFAACTTTIPPAAAPPDPHGLTIAEEAKILRLEDRREFDIEIAQDWLANPNPLHRQRMALALGRIGPSTFVDSNGNGSLDSGEQFAGVQLLSGLTNDPEFGVRTTAAFALGEIGDPAALDTLFTMTGDQHADVAAEAVEAISKMAAKAPLERYRALTAESSREAVRARAVRFLFRFDNDAASQIAADLLADPSVVLRREAAYALSRRGFAPARTRLELLLNDNDALTRSYAARALGRIGDAASLGRLFAATTDSDPWVRTEVSRSIGQIATKTPAAIQGAELTSNVLRLIALTQDADPGTRAVSIDTIGLFAPLEPLAKERLYDLAANGSKWERERAAAAIAGHLGDATDSPLATILSNADTGIKRAVLESTAALPAGVEMRKRLAADSDATVRAAVVGSIPDASVESEIALIRTALADPDPIVRSNAIDRFGAWKTAPPAEMLATLLDAETRTTTDTLDDARLSAIAEIGAFDSAKLTDAEIAAAHFAGKEEYLRGLLSDRDPVVRRTAADLIATTIKKPRPQYTPLAIDQPASYYEEIVKWSRQKHTARIHLARGNIELILLTQEAPMTTRNFADLARRGYFDNTSFMRVVPDFVIQGGDPRNDMSGGPGYAIRDEINLQKYTRGAVGMALSGPDTGGSQYFITHSPQPHLDGGYTIFARVTGGMNEVVDQVERGDKVMTITIDDK